EAVDPPFEEIGAKESDGNDQQLPGPDIAQIRDVDVERGEADGVDDEDVEPAIVPAGDALAVGLAVAALAIGHGGRSQFHLPLPSVKSVTCVPSSDISLIYQGRDRLSKEVSGRKRP